jgi:hypothetical protein
MSTSSDSPNSEARTCGIAPSHDDLAEAVHIALAQLDMSAGAGSSTQESPAPGRGPDIVIGAAGVNALYPPGSLNSAVDEIARLYGRRVYDLAELAAGVAAAVNRIPLLITPPLQRFLASQAAWLATAAALDRLGYRLDLTKLDSLLLQLHRDPTASTALVQVLADMILPALARPRVIILTPLTNVGEDQAHAEIVQVGEIVTEQLQPDGFAVDCPGLRLHPDSSHDWDPPRMYRAERRRILGAGMVALATADIASWGLGQSKAWAETNTAIVVEFTNSSSRALGPGNPFGTVTDPWESPEATAQTIVEMARDNRTRLVTFDSDRIAVRQRWATSMLGAVDTRDLNTSRLTDTRRDTILLDPDEAATATLTELRHLRQSNPVVADRLIDTLTGREVSVRLDPGDLPGQSRQNFERACSAAGADQRERDLLLQILAQRTGDLVHSRTLLSEDDVARALLLIRGRLN